MAVKGVPYTGTAGKDPHWTSMENSWLELIQQHFPIQYSNHRSPTLILYALTDWSLAPVNSLSVLPPKPDIYKKIIYKKSIVQYILTLQKEQ